MLLPLRAIFEALGATVEWDGNTQIEAMILLINHWQKSAYKNNVSVELDVPAKAVNGRILVPVRFVSEVLGAEVEWDTQNRIVRMKQKAN
jgi:iron complex transport system substrate-binding protein